MSIPLPPLPSLPSALLAHLVAFARDEDACVLRLPRTLSREERKGVHLWCEGNAGGWIEHDSVGYGNNRYLVLRKAVAGSLDVDFSINLEENKTQDLDENKSIQENKSTQSAAADSVNEDDAENLQEYRKPNKSKANRRDRFPGLSIVDIIPPEILLNVFSFCDCVTLCKLACSCFFFKDCIDDQTIWRELCQNVYPSMYNSVLAEGGDESDWKRFYILRHKKQQQWDSKKQKPLKATEVAPGSQSSTRLKMCKRCHERFNPSNNTPTSCTFHTGAFVHKDDCITCNELNDFKSKRTPKMALAERIGRKARHSATRLKNNYTFMSAHGECQFEYTCCGAVFSGAPGCKQGRHT